MTQQASVPPDPHHRTSSDIKPAPVFPRGANAPGTTAARLSPTASQDREPRHLLYRDEQHDIQFAERGNYTTSTSSNYATIHDHDTTRRSEPSTAANSPRGTTGAVGNSDHPGSITSTMAPGREGAQADSALPSTIAAAAAAALAASTDDRSAQPASSRALGVQNILNPSEAQAAVHSPATVPRTSSRGNTGIDTGESRALPRTRPSSASSPQIGSASSASSNHHGRTPQSHHAQPPPGYQIGGSNSTSRLHGPSGFASVNYGSGYGQPASGEPGQATSTTRSPGMGFVPLSGGNGSDQGSSPRLTHSHTNPAFASQPRRILTPKSPRRSSLGRGLPGMGAPGSQHPLFPRGGDTPPVPPIPPNRLHQSMSAPNIGPGSGSGSGSGQMAGAVPGSYFPQHGASGPPPSMVTEESPRRPYVQPFYPNEGGGHRDNRGQAHETQQQQQHHHHQQQQQQQEESQQSSRFPYPPGAREGGFATTTTPTRTVSASNVNTGSGESQWGSHGAAGGQGGPGSGVGGGRSVSMSVSEGQQFITITPSYGEEIHVPVDVHQASKQADEKRLRNAGASARFRARKKEKDREAQMGIQRLETMNRDLQKRNQDLEQQRDFYRNERNRLRHIMSQSPSMREYVESGPPSPASTSLSGRSYVAEGSPMTGGSSQHAPAQHPQAPPQHQQPPPQHQMLQQAQQQPPRPHIQHHQQQQQQQHQQQQHPHHQIAPAHAPAPLYPPMSTAPEYSGPPPAHLGGPPDSSAGMERPAQRRRTDSGPNIEYYTPSYTTSAPPPAMLPSSLPPPPPPAGGASRFHSMSPSPLSGSPSNPRLPPLRLDTPGSNQSSVGVGGGMGTGPPTPELAHGNASALPTPQHYQPTTTTSSAYSRPYDTAGWAADSPAPHQQHQPPDSKYQR